MFKSSHIIHKELDDSLYDEINKDPNLKLLFKNVNKDITKYYDILKVLKTSVEKLKHYKEYETAFSLEKIYKKLKLDGLNNNSNYSIGNLKKSNKEISSVLFNRFYNEITNQERPVKTPLKIKNLKFDYNNYLAQSQGSYQQNQQNQHNSFKSINKSNDYNEEELNEITSDISCDQIDYDILCKIPESTLLSKIDSHDFNIFKLEKETNFAFMFISNCIFMRKDLFKIYDYEKFDNFMKEIEKGYIKSNPYHNSLHAADVAQSCFVYFTKAKMDRCLKLDKLDLSLLIISALIHDYKHPGYNNNFLINSNHILALNYNDTSILESYHVSESFKLIKEDERFNIFSFASNEDYKKIRKRVVDMVVNTDMTLHFKLMKFFQEKENLKSKEDKTEGIPNDKLITYQQEFLNGLLHAADISNPTKPTSLYVEWAERVMKEFWIQGDLEKEKKMPVSYLCDRNIFTVAKAQIGFIDGIVLPFFKSISLIFDDSLNFLIDNINKNKSYYIKQKELDEMKEDL